MIFPSLCLHCEADTDQLLCANCTKQLEFIHPTDCPAYNIGAAFENYGPAATLLRAFKTDRAYLAKTIASFLVIQYKRLGWPLPDLIVPVPQSRWHRLLFARNHADLLARELGIFFERPVAYILRRRSGDFPQSKLTLPQRAKLDSSAFTLKSTADISDRSLLLVDDLIVTGATLRTCLAALKEGYPKSLYGLTFCCES